MERGIETLVAHASDAIGQDQWLLKVEIQQQPLVLMCWMSWGLAAQASEKLPVILLFRNGCIDRL